MTDTTHYASIGGDGDKLVDVIRGGWRADLALKDAAKLGRRALAGSGNGASIDDLDERTLEIAILDRRARPYLQAHRSRGGAEPVHRLTARRNAEADLRA